jgi:hypothetical protein
MGGGGGSPDSGEVGPKRAGEGRDGTCVHVGLSSRGLDGSEQWPVRGSAALGLGVRGEPCSGEQAGRPDQCAGGQAQGGRGEGLDVFSRHGIVARHRAHRGVPMAGRRPARRRAR